jgi:hypothetical protein
MHQIGNNLRVSQIALMTSSLHINYMIDYEGAKFVRICGWFTLEAPKGYSARRIPRHVMVGQMVKQRDTVCCKPRL